MDMEYIEISSAFSSCSVSRSHLLPKFLFESIKYTEHPFFQTRVFTKFFYFRTTARCLEVVDAGFHATGAQMFRRTSFFCQGADLYSVGRDQDR